MGAMSMPGEDCHPKKPEAKTNSALLSDYVPFGDEWKKEMMKLPKWRLIEMLKAKLST